jgi:hypothetical protein
LSDLKEDLDRALRTVTFGEAPIEQAKRRGHRIRTRRRVTLLAGALAIAAIAAGYPALTRTAAAPPAPATGQKTAPIDRNPVLTDGSGSDTTEAPGGLTDKSGIVAAGTMGSVKWNVTVHGPRAANPVPADSCYTVTLSTGLDGNCTDLPSVLGSGLGSSVPARFTETGSMTAATGTMTTEVTIGVVAPDVTYFFVTFDDGQRLKLIPVTAGGHRYIAWAAPASMTIISVVAHLGGPYSDSGQIASTAPFEEPGLLPVFGLWQADGESAPPRDSKVIASGTADGLPWKTSAYEGPWGTCFVSGPDGLECVPAEQLVTTAVLGGWGGNPNPPDSAAFGSAAPGVALVRVTLSDGKTVEARPVLVGNEDLFAFAIPRDVTPISWTAYNASGHQAGTGTVAAGGATGQPVSAP